MARHKKSAREKVMQETRQRLLEAAAVEFAQWGFSGANVNRISERAGFSIGTIYNYFPSKRDLMHAFIDEVAQTHVEYIVAQVKVARQAAARLNLFFQAGFAFVETHYNQARAIFNVLNGPDEAFRSQLHLAYQPLFQMLSQDVLGPGIAQGEFRQVKEASIAGLLMMIYLGTSSQLSPEGRFWLEPEQVASFALHALRRTEADPGSDTNWSRARHPSE
jgi:AcrR family transcriptional regulator